MRLITAFLLVLAALASAGQGSDAAVRRAISARMAAYDKAVTGNDSRAMLAIMAKGFRSVDQDGTSYTADALVEGMKSNGSKLKVNSLKTSITSMTVEKGGVIIGATSELDANLQGEGGNWQHTKLVTKNRQYWVQEGGAWKIRGVRTLSTSQG